MALEKKHGRTLRSVTVDGQEIRPRDGMFVFFMPGGTPCAAMASDHKMMDDIAMAARSYWKNESIALRKLNDGYRIEFMAAIRFYRELAATVEPDTNN